MARKETYEIVATRLYILRRQARRRRFTLALPERVPPVQQAQRKIPPPPPSTALHGEYVRVEVLASD